MASAGDLDGARKLGDAIVAFALEGRFPDSDDVSSICLSNTDLSPAIEALAKARAELEEEIKTISAETEEDCSTWVSTAQSLRDDLLRTKTLANEILLEAETPDVSGKATQDAEDRVEFLTKELAYSRQLFGALEGIQHANELLSQVEEARNERRILESLHLLEQSWSAMDAIPLGKTCRAVKLLDVRSFELKSDVHEVFDHVWKALVNVDIDNSSIVVFDERDDEQMSLSDAVIGLKAYKEVEERMEQLWHNLDAAIISPRMNTEAELLPSVKADANTLSLSGEADRSIETLLSDLETVFTFLAQKLPTDLLEVLCAVMMGDVMTKVVKVWLNSAIPPAVRDANQFERVIEKAREFCSVLEKFGYTGWDELGGWVNNAPTVWLSKCRETALDSVRTKLSNGIGSSRQVEKIEKQMVSMAEAHDLAATSGAVAAAADNDDWDAGWADEGQGNGAADPMKVDEEGAHIGADDGADAWGWDDNGQDDQDDQDNPPGKTTQPDNKAEDEDDTADAWGWGDGDDDEAGKPEDNATESEVKKENGDEGDAWGWGDEATTTVEPPPAAEPKKAKSSPSRRRVETREMVLKETYHISSMPEPVLGLIFAILEDGAALTQAGSEVNPVATAAAGLFGVPTLALALFRGISPYYYSLDMGGNMFLYNDAMYLAEKLSDFSKAWKARDDLSARARKMLRLENDVRSLEAFARRAYSNEMSTQKTVIRDLLGGSDSLMQQDEIESCLDSAVARVRSMAVTWEDILGRSVWYQAVGSLADTISSKIIADVMDMSSIGQDEAYSTAQLIAKVTELDDLFLPSRAVGKPKEPGEIAATAQYASTWLRLQYLSEVLQSNLNEVKYLWFESELSLYFTAEEVIDLVNLSFEANARTKEVIREISQKPHPIDI